MKPLRGTFQTFENSKKIFDFHKMSYRKKKEEEEERRTKQALDSPQTIEANKNFIAWHTSFAKDLRCNYTTGPKFISFSFFDCEFSPTNFNS